MGARWRAEATAEDSEAEGVRDEKEVNKYYALEPNSVLDPCVNKPRQKWGS